MNVHALHPAAPAAKPRELRREPRYKLPARLVIDGTSITVLDWSRSGVGFLIKGAEINRGDRFLADLVFDLPGATLSTGIDAQIEHYDQRTGRGGLSYELQPEDGESAIDLIVDEYLAGRIKVRDGMLVKSETTRTAPRIGLAAAKENNALNEGLRRLAGLGLFTILGGAAALFLGTSIYDRLFVFEAASAQVAFETVEVDSPVAGTLTAMAPAGPITNGATLFSIVDAEGVVTEVASPCTCEVATGGRGFGAFVSAGSVVTKLVRTDSSPRVLVSVNFPDVRRVYEGAAVDIRYLDGQAIRSAHILSIRSLGGQQSGLVTIEVDPGRLLKPSQFGEPVYARFDTAPWRLTGRLSAGGAN
ncbi:MAG TPA: PilZ domain-containing protein [Devosia sp.]|nr:PilZ domain-containing protein [Devosia sp.]